MAKQSIKDRWGRIIGSIETDNQGNATGKDFYGYIVGYYEAQLNRTKDRWGQLVGHGNQLSSLIYQAEAKYEMERESKKNGQKK